VIKETETTWVDSNNNSWSKLIYTKEQAEKYSVTLINCSGCRGCSYCRDCSGCSDCSDCSGCRGCSYCRDCRDCRGCRDCSGCSGFKNNPERIVSPVMGSRKSQTAVYWVADDIQVVCGCFRGGLVKFREQVIATHGNNEHGVAYLAWIDRVERYIGAIK
jgi:hypothetical protein